MDNSAISYRVISYKHFYILLAFSLITIALLITVIIYSYLKKYLAKQQDLLPSHNANNKLEEVMY